MFVMLSIDEPWHIPTRSYHFYRIQSKALVDTSSQVWTFSVILWIMNHVRSDHFK